MQMLTLEESADYLEFAKIKRTVDLGHAIVHLGRNAAGVDFMLVNDTNGNSALTEST